MDFFDLFDEGFLIVDEELDERGRRRTEMDNEFDIDPDEGFDRKEDWQDE